MRCTSCHTAPPQLKCGTDSRVVGRVPDGERSTRIPPPEAASDCVVSPSADDPTFSRFMTDKSFMDPHPAKLPPDQLLQSCAIERTRHSGPGGQHRNKVETAIRITHQPTGLVAFAGESRQQEVNRRKAVERLRRILAIEIRCVESDVVTPSSMWEQRCRKQKIQCSESHGDFPALLAEAMDAVDAKEYDVRRAAAALGCSTTQLVRFLARVPDALERVNAERVSRGMRPLKS